MATKFYATVNVIDSDAEDSINSRQLEVIDLFSKGLSKVTSIDEVRTVGKTKSATYKHHVDITVSRIDVDMSIKEIIKRFEKNFNFISISESN